ncbi:hypothetical protein A2U01_0081170 [Trifolium medium]|uniref:Uncharacterized protein n=1 Tax=Trifolium medium TaxID=97028 RepID=A0A392TJ18_9FABA|nr:hypothetical protein [Trifolium medium]
MTKGEKSDACSVVGAVRGGLGARRRRVPGLEILDMLLAQGAV